MAVPNPEKELSRLRAEIRRGIPAVVVICGAEPFFRGEALDLVRSRLGDEVELRRIEGSEETDGTELQDLRAATLFGTPRWVLVRRGAPWLKAHADALLATLPRMAPGNGLILEVERLDKRTKLARQLAASGAVFEFRTLYDTPFDRRRSPLEGELVQWVVGRGRQLGVALTEEAAWLLAEQAGKAPAKLVAALQTLARSLGERPARGALDPREVQERLDWTADSTPFELAEALLAGNRARATRSLQALFRHGTKGRDGKPVDGGGVFPFTANWLSTAIGQVYQGRLLLEQGVPLREVPARLGVRMFGDRLQAQVQANDLGRLRRGLLALLQCQRDLRFSGEDPELLLERFLAVWFGTAPLSLTRAEAL